MLSGEAVIVWLVVGAAIGWLASQIMNKGSFGIPGDIMVGVAGALVGGVVLPAFFLLGGQQALLLGHIVNSSLGAVIGTFAARLVRPAQ